MKKRALIISLLFVMTLWSCKEDEVSPNDSGTISTETGDDINVALSVQDKLNAGTTPLEIYEENDALLDSLYGKTYQGGLIVYLDTEDGSGLIATENDIDTAFTLWGCLNTVLGKNLYVGDDPFNGVPIFEFVPYAIGEGIGSGRVNTDQINETCLISAALICEGYEENGFDDWFMPSKDEMLEVSKALSSIQELRETYWTSTQENTQSSAAKVHVVFTSDHSSSLEPKADKIGRGLRAVRSF